MNTESRWVTIEGAEGYEVNEIGEVRNAATLRLRKFSRRRAGYLNCSMRLEGGKSVCRYVHRLVAAAFIPQPEGRSEVNHKDGNPENNKVENLEWVTHRENMEDAFKRNGGHWSKGKSFRRTRVTSTDPLGTVESWDSLALAANSLGVKYSTFAPLICRAISKGWAAYGRKWER